MATKALTLYFILSCAALFASAQSDGTNECEAAKAAYHTATGILDLEGEAIYSRLQSAKVPSVCRLPKTCCSRYAEQNLTALAVEDVRQRIGDNWELRTSSCQSLTFKDALTEFIEDNKRHLLDLLDTAYFGFFTRRTLFDEFYNYLQDTIRTTDSCQIGYKFNKLFFEVFLAVLEADPGVDTSLYPLDDRDFNICLYNYYQDISGEDTHARFVALTRSLNRTLYYLRALNVGEAFLTTVSELELTAQCRQALMRSSHCAQCGGESSLVRPCQELCLNTLRGCLVDYSDLSDPYYKFAQAAVRMKEYLDEYVNPFNQLGQQLISAFFNAISTTERSSRTTHEEILVRCLGSRGRREAEASRDSDHARQSPRSLFTRATLPPPPSTVFNHSAYCLLEQAPLFRSLPDSVCGETSAARGSEECWNGEAVARYERDVLDFVREDQRDNPEIIVCPTLPHQVKVQLARLKRVTQEMNIITRSEACPEDDEDCTVDNQRCDFNAFPSLSINSAASTVTHSTSDDEENAQVGSGGVSGCGLDGVSGFGSGSGGCEPVVMEEVEECVADPMYPSSTIVVPSTTVVEPYFTTISVPEPSISIVKPPLSLAPTTTPPPTKEPPVVIITQAGSLSLVPSALALLLSLLSSLAALQGVL